MSVATNRAQILNVLFWVSLVFAILLYSMMPVVYFNSQSIKKNSLPFSGTIVQVRDKVRNPDGSLSIQDVNVLVRYRSPFNNQESQGWYATSSGSLQSSPTLSFPLGSVFSGWVTPRGGILDSLDSLNASVMPLGYVATFFAVISWLCRRKVKGTSRSL